MIASSAVVEHKCLYHFNLHFKATEQNMFVTWNTFLQQKTIYPVYYINLNYIKMKSKQIVLCQYSFPLFITTIHRVLI